MVVPLAANANGTKLSVLIIKCSLDAAKRNPGLVCLRGLDPRITLRCIQAT